MKRNDNGTVGGYIQLAACDKTISTELSGDFTLPDYQPEIKRLLRVGASVLPSSKYVGDRECELAGNIDYFLLYMGSDNAIYCAPLTGEYKINIPFSSGDGEDIDSLRATEVVATTVPDMISGRVCAPRKVSIKCRLRTRAQLLCEMPLDYGFDNTLEDMQTLKKTLAVSRASFGISEQLRVSDEMICDNKDEEIRIISADGKILMSEVTASAGTVNCRGDIYLKLLLCSDEGGLPYTSTRKLPIFCSVHVDGADQGASATAKGTVSEMGIAVEDGRISIDLGYIVEAQVCRDEEITFVKDAYSIGRRADNSYKRVSIPKNAAAFMGNFTLSDSLSLDEAGIASGSRVIDVCGVAFPEEYYFDGGRCAVGGRARFSLLLEKDGEYSVTDIEIPFNYRALSSGEYENMICSAEIVSIRARIDGERVGVDAEIGVSGKAMHSEREEMISHIGFGEAVERGRGEFVICYPSGEDSLWSVAKRYGAPLEELFAKNGITDDGQIDRHDSIDGLNYLII